jgi:hypothetical protein
MIVEERIFVEALCGHRLGVRAAERKFVPTGLRRER